MSHLLFGPVQPSPVLWYKVSLHKMSTKAGFFTISAVSIQWKGLLESTTGMSFDLKVSNQFSLICKVSRWFSFLNEVSIEE